MQETPTNEMMARLNELKAYGHKAEKTQASQIGFTGAKVLRAAAFVFLGVALGAASMQAVATVDQSHKVSDSTMEWIVLEIANNRQVTPAAARSILAEKLTSSQ
jgi:hypothetical protein